MDSYDVRFWDTKKIADNASGGRYRVRWAVNGQEHCKSFKNKALADGFFDDLKTALTEAQYRSPLGRRPYDLRHAAVSLWLNSGVPATEVARRAGHGVAVLLKIYAHCIDGQADAANQRITDALGTKGTEPEPGDEEDGDSKMAS